MRSTTPSMVDTVNVTRQMERNANLGISDFFLVEHEDGKSEWAGTMDLRRVLEIVQKKVIEEECCNTAKWIPEKPLPDFPSTLDQVLKSPDLLKKSAKLCMEWLLSHQRIKKAGDEGFLGWSFPIDRDLFVINDKS